MGSALGITPNTGRITLRLYRRRCARPWLCTRLIYRAIAEQVQRSFLLRYRSSILSSSALSRRRFTVWADQLFDYGFGDLGSRLGTVGSRVDVRDDHDRRACLWVMAREIIEAGQRIFNFRVKALAKEHVWLTPIPKLLLKRPRPSQWWAPPITPRRPQEPMDEAQPLYLVSSTQPLVPEIVAQAPRVRSQS